MSLEELYSILELPPGASLDEVKRAYRDLAQVWHPDRFTGKPHLQDRAVRNMAEINAAYRELVRHLRASERAGADSSHSRRSPASAASAGSRKRDGRAGEAPASAGVRARHAPGDQPARSRVGDETASQGDAKDEVRAAGAAPASSEVPEASALLRRRRFLQALAGAWLLGALLALGGAFRSAAPAPSLRPIAGLPKPSVSLQALVTGGGHSCALAGDGRLYCWGADDAGQLGGAATRRCGADPDYACSPAPVLVAPDLRFNDVAVGLDHSCALMVDGTAYCWGAGFAGQIGDGSTVARDRPVPLEGELRFETLSALGQHTCGLTESRRIYCWGRHTDGELGNPDALRQCRLGRLAFGCAPYPVAVIGDEFWSQVAAGASHTCGLDEDGTARCWGSNRSGQLGARAPALCPDEAGTHACAVRPIQVSGGLRFRQLAAGAAHTCGIDEDGRVFCWGRNDVGQLGTGSTEERTVPTLVAGEQRFESVVAGGFHTCAVTAAKALFCWGHDAFGQLGAATRERCGGVPCATRPLRVSLTRVASASAGFFGTCALTAAGPLCWGRNESGQLGTGEIRASDAAVKEPMGQPAPASSWRLTGAASSIRRTLANAWARIRSRAEAIPAHLEQPTAW